MQYRYLQMARTRWENTLSDCSILRFWRRYKNQAVKSAQKKLQNKTINLPSYVFSGNTLDTLASFFIHFMKFCHLYE